jgi:hypothetical protein
VLMAWLCLPADTWVIRSVPSENVALSGAVGAFEVACAVPVARNTPVATARKTGVAAVEWVVKTNLWVPDGSPGTDHPVVSRTVPAAAARIAAIFARMPAMFDPPVSA